MVARETAKRQRARTAKEEDQDMKSIQVPIHEYVFMGGIDLLLGQIREFLFYPILQRI